MYLRTDYILEMRSGQLFQACSVKRSNLRSVTFADDLVGLGNALQPEPYGESAVHTEDQRHDKLENTAG